MLGANYIMSTQDVGFSVDQEGNGLQLAGAYTLHENLRLSAGYQRFEFKGPFNTCLTDFGGSFCDTLDGNVGYIETTFSF
jgi:hypothetical protein